MKDGRRPLLTNLMVIALAGAAGTLSRYWMQEAVQHWSGSRFPWGTLAVNALGCFLFGVIWTLAEERALLSRELRIMVLTGFMGAFTTFSTFAFETGQQTRQAEWLYAAGNIVVQVGLGLFCVFLGFAVARWF